MSQSRQVRVAVIDPHSLFTECLGVVLEMQAYSYTVVPIPRQAQSEQRVLTQLMAARPDVVLVNADLGPTCNAMKLIEPLALAGVAVVAITESADEASRGGCLTHGAQIALPKTEPLTSIISVVSELGRGRPVLDRAERDRLMRIYHRHGSTSREARTRLDKLSAQEGEILRHLMAGRTVQEIATRRVVAEGTVRTQVRSILSKLGLSSQLAAVAVAYQGGWEPGPLASTG